MSAFQTMPLTAEMKLRVRELDPKQVCGQGTTVREVWLVTADGHPEYQGHNVFWDRHGLYCARCGRDCAAVAAVERERVKRQAGAGAE